MLCWVVTAKFGNYNFKVVKISGKKMFLFDIYNFLNLPAIEILFLDVFITSFLSVERDLVVDIHYIYCI